MNTDSYYEIGSSHVVCEDYALSGVHEDLAYALVCDGCSSSDNSDVGARLLAHIAKDALLYLHRRKYLYDRNFLSQEFKKMFQEMVLKKCWEVRETLKLEYTAFDSTLMLVAAINGETIVTFGRGDGRFVRKLSNGDILSFHCSYESGAPYYLSYDMQFDREKVYNDEFGKSPVTIALKGTGTHYIDQNLKTTYNDSVICETFFNTSGEIVQIGVTSDGVETYEDNMLEPVKKDAMDILREMTNYKNLAGDFVQRRMTRMKKDLSKVGIIHQDDISFAAINLLG